MNFLSTILFNPRIRRPLTSQSALPGSLLADWFTRSTADGVVRAQRFTSSSDVSTWVHPDGQAGRLSLNATGGLIGDGCLYISNPASDGSSSGAWRIPLAPPGYGTGWTTNANSGFPLGTDVYIQFSQRFGPDRLYRAASGTDVNGPKICIIGGYTFADPGNSNSDIAGEIVLEHHLFGGGLIPYRDDRNVGGGTAVDWSYSDGDGLHLQNIDNGAAYTDDNERFCLYQPSGSANGDSMSAGCWRQNEQEWTTWYVHYKLAAVNTSTGSSANVIEIFAQRPGESGYTLITSRTGFTISADSTLGTATGPAAIWLLDYTTNRTSGPTNSWKEFDQLIISTSPIAPRAVIDPTWRASLTTIGAFVQLGSATAISSVTPSPVPPGNGPENKVDAWNSFAVNPRSSRIYTVATGGHNDYYGNEVDELRLDLDTPSWVQIHAPSSNADIGSGGVDYYADGRPCSRHTQNGVIFNIHDNRVQLLAGWRAHATGQWTNSMDAYSLTSQEYLADNTFPDVPSQITGDGGAPRSVMEADPRTGDIYCFSQGYVYKWTRASNAWTQRMSANGVTADMACGAYDTFRNRVLVVGGSGGDQDVYDVTANTMTGVTLTGASASTITGSNQAALVYVRAMDAYLFRASGSGGAVLQIDARTWAVTTFSTSGGSSIPTTLNGPFKKFWYLPNLRAIAYTPTYSDGVWVMRVY